MTAALRFVVVGLGRMGAALRASLRGRLVGVRYVARRDLAGFARRTQRRVCWVLAVRDAQVADTVDALGDRIGRNDAVLHLAGALGPSVLAAARARGAAVGALHPMFAVAAGNARRDGLVGAAFTFEGDPGARSAARAIVRALRGTMIDARRVDRAAYHGAAALLATGAVALAQGAARLLARAVEPAPDDAQTRAAVRSLLVSVAHNVEAVGAQRALASPLLRDDTDTVARHLDAMEPDPAVRELYRAAVSLVLDALETHALVKAETVSEARRLTAPRTPR